MNLVKQDEIFGSAFAAAVYISSVIKLPKDKKVYVIGMSGLEEELQEEGVLTLGGTVCSLHLHRGTDLLTQASTNQPGSPGQHISPIYPSGLDTGRECWRRIMRP